MKIQKRESAKPFITLDGSLIREIVHPNSSGAVNQSLAEASLGPGQATSRHIHQKSEEIYYIVSGSGRIHISGEEAVVGKDDAVIIPPGTDHYIENIDDMELVLLCCSAPAYSDSDTDIM